MRSSLLARAALALAVAGVPAAFVIPAASAHEVCAADAPQSVTSARPGAATALVPAGPTQLLLCRYNGLPNPPVTAQTEFALDAQQLVTDEATVTQLASELDALQPGPLLPAPMACPFDPGNKLVAYFRYATEPDNPVLVSLSGCEYADNGYITRLAGSVVPQFEALVSGPASVQPPPAIYAISGSVQLCGGIAPPPGRSDCRTSTLRFDCPGRSCATTDRVRFSGASTQTTVELRHARFSTSLPAGRYTAQLLADGRHVHGKVVMTQTLTVGAGALNTVRFSIPIKAADAALP